MAGVTTTGATVLFEDDTDGDAGGDGSYSPADIAAQVTLPLGGAATWGVTAGNPVIVRTGGAALVAADDERLIWGPGIARNSRITSVADPNATMDKNAEVNVAAAVLTASEFAQIDPGLIRAVYAATKSLQNGDGVGTAVTTFRATDVRIEFLNGRTYSVSAVGQVNRVTHFGNKVVGANGYPSGRNGVMMDCGAIPTIRGLIKLYGSYIRQNAAGAINLIPGSSGLLGEIVNCILETTSGTGNIVCGLINQELDLLYNVDFVLGGTGAITNILANTAQRITIAVTGSNNYCINSGSPYTIRDCVLIGTPLLSDLHNIAGITDQNLIDPTWTGNAPKIDVTNGNINEWFGFNVESLSPDTGIVVPGVPIEVYDSFDVLVASGITNAQGNIAFGAGPFTSALKVLVHTPGTPPVPVEQGPFRVVVNQGASALPGYIGYTSYFTWIYRDLPSGFGKQYFPMVLPVWMVPVDGGGATGKEEWRPSHA